MVVIWKENKEKTVIVSQNGRYIEFNKRGSPLVYKYDMGSHEFYCEEKRTGERKHVHDNRATNTWFNAKLVTDDNKIANMFMFAKSLAGGNPGIRGIMAKFADQQVQCVEQWAALGTSFRPAEHAWGNRRSGTRLHVHPNEVDREIRDFIAEKTWSIAELNNFVHIFDNVEDKNIINKIFNEITDHPEYASAFVMVQHGHAKNYLYDPETLNHIVHIIDTYNMEVERFMFYINYLNEVERISIFDLLQTYDQYLSCELEKQDGRRNRMYKHPIHYYSVYYTQQEIIRREAELEHYVPDDHIYENAYLEYQDDQYLIKIPRSAEDVRDEGRQQGHCIAQQYINHIAVGDTVCVFMRKVNQPDRSYITIEIRNNVIRQACVGDNNSVPEEQRQWIRHWAALKGVEIDEHDSWRTARVY
jgi:hypothetical protein